MIGSDWTALIELLRRTNRPSEFTVGWHHPRVSFEVAWTDPERFARQFEIWTTTDELSPGGMLTIREGEEFRIENSTRPGWLLSLHSRVVVEGGRRFFLMLDLLAPHGQLDRVELYLAALMRKAGIPGTGFVVRTSRSFHFIGKECVDAAIYGKTLDLVLRSGGGNGIVDIGYCAHTLARHLETGLRIEPRGPEEGLRVVAEVRAMGAPR